MNNATSNNLYNGTIFINVSYPDNGAFFEKKIPKNMKIDDALSNYIISAFEKLKFLI